MSVYRRYFAIKDAATLAAIDLLLSKKNFYRQALEAISKDVGAHEIYYDQRNGDFAGFSFNGTPDKAHWRKVSGEVYYPKKGSKSGKALAVKIEAMPVPAQVNTALSDHGLDIGHFGCLTVGLKFYRPQICGSPSAGWFAVVPWMDVNPEDLETYKHEKVSCKRLDGNYDHLLWTPPIEWVEVKEWEVKKAMDEAKAVGV